MTHEELLVKITEKQDPCCFQSDPRAWLILRAVAELPRNFTDKMNINIVNEQDPVTLAKMFYKAGYKNAMNKVIEAIEKELG